MSSLRATTIGTYVKDHITAVYFSCLFAALAAFHILSFGDPPRSDNLSILYFFHHLDQPGAWLHVMNYDPWTQARYYPLAHLVMYAEFLLFGSHQVMYHLVHFAVYCGVLALLYRFATRLGCGRAPSMVFIAVYAFLYSHSDIISWAEHTYILAGFAFCLTGFLSYLAYMRNGNAVFIASAAMAFLAGLWCYETYVLWPAGIVFLSLTGHLSGNRAVSRRDKAISCAAILVPVYVLYAAGWIFTRMLKTYETPLLDMGALFSFATMARGLMCALFALPHNGIFVNLAPFAAFPPRFEDQVFEMAGIFVAYERHFNMILAAGAVLGACAVGALLWYMVRRYGRGQALVCLFILFLFLSEYGVLAATRSMTNPCLFILQQFRYQFVPNACAGLVILCVPAVSRPSAKAKRNIMLALLAFVFAMNAYFGFQSALYVHRGLAPLRDLLNRISSMIGRNSVSESNRIYMDDSLPRYLPPVCWNERMGSAFMKGTYQWIFDKRQIRFFAWSPTGARYIIDPRTRAILENPEFLNAQ